MTSRQLSTALLYLYINSWLKSMWATRSFYEVSYYFDHIGIQWSTDLVESFPEGIRTNSLQFGPDNTGHYKPEITNRFEDYSELVQGCK